MKVCKFGGTSMATVASILNVKSIIESDSERKYVIVSAPGKRFSSDIKITDLLYSAYQEKLETGSCAHNIALIRARFVDLAKELGVDVDMNKYVDEVEEGILKSTSADYAASRGEYLSAIIMSAVLGFDMLDARIHHHTLLSDCLKQYLLHFTVVASNLLTRGIRSITCRSAQERFVRRFAFL